MVTVPVPTSGISVTPVDGTDDNNNPTSSVTATEPNGDLLVPAGKDFQVEVEVEPGYEIPPEGITIGGNENVKDGDVITVTPGGTPINNPTGVTATVYSIVYKKVNDSDSTTETPTEISTWTSSTGVVTTFTVETAKVTLPTKTNIAHSTDNTKELLGWKLGSNTVTELDSALIKKIINGEIAAPNKKLDLVTVWQTKGAVSYEVWKYVEKTDSTDSTNISNFTKTTQITSGSATEGSSATYTPIAADAETGFTITVIPVTSLSSASGADNIVKVKYIRNQVTLTFKLQNTTDGKWSDNTTENKTIVGKYGATVSGVPSVTPNTNYGSDGWDVTPPETFPAENKTYTAKWKQEKANYTAQTWFEKVGSADHTSLDSDHYEKNASYTDTTYSANLNTQVMAPTIYPVPAGFELYSAPMVTLNSDGSTVVGTYYKRKDITLTFALADTTGGKWNDGTEGTKTVSGNYGASVTGVPSPTPNTHYAFAGWTSGGVAVSSLPTTFTESKTYTANWSQTGANYTVKYWFEDVDSADPANASNYAQDQSRDNAAYKDKTLSGTVGNSVTDTSPVAAPTGFTQRTITPVTLLANGTTVVNVYYQRKDITLTFTLQNTTGGKWSDNTTANKTISGNYGATVTGIPGVTANAHYASDGWDATPPGTFPAENKTYTAKWKQTEGKYTVKTYKQKSTAAYGAFATTFANFDASNYDLTDTQEKWGTIGGTTNESTAAVTGFTAARYNQCSITTDGNAVVTVWYDRNDVTLSLLNGDYGNWASSKTIQGKYGANVTNSYGNPGSSDSHFAFDAWSPVIPSTVPAGDASYTAQWKRIKADYTIKYWFEKEGSTDASAYGTNYEQNTASYANVQKTAAYPGTASGEQLTSVPTGFTHAKTDTGITLAETGTVVNVYYKRNTVTLTFKITDTTGGTWNNGSNWTVSGKYGSAVSYENMPAAQPVNSYFEVSWTPAKPEKFPTTDTTYTLTWIDNTPTTGEVSITITGAGDISVVNDSTNNRLTAQAPSGISLTYVWYNITSGTPVQAGTGANFSYASLSAGKYTFLLEGTKTDNTSIKYTTTFELVKQ